MTTPFVAEFLAGALRHFIALSAFRGQPWKNTKIAQYISDHEAVPGKISDTTLGRFLDPGSKQAPSAETLAAVAAFLIQMRAITQEQLDAVTRNPLLADAAAFPAIFPAPETKARRAFTDDLVGQYGSCDLQGEHLLLSDVMIQPLPDTGALISQEVLSLFQIKNVDLLKRETRNLAPDAILGIWPKLAAFGGREIESYTSSGFVIATTDIVAFFLRGSVRGFPSILNVRQIDFSADERVRGFGAWRNSGWSSSAEAPRRSSSIRSPRERMRMMAEELVYTKNIIDKMNAKEQNGGKARRHSQSTGQDFFRPAAEDTSRIGGHIENAHDSTERLLASIANGDLDAFRQALSDQADANATFPGSPDPIVFALAADGRLEWVEALIATGRCDVLRLGSSGFSASYAPGVTARFFAAAGPAELVEKFSALARLLYNEETRQRSVQPASSLQPK